MQGVPMSLYVAAGLAGLCIALAVPLILGKVPPNPVYGLRTKETLADPILWYRANRLAGWLLLGAGGVSLVGIGLLAWWRPAIGPTWMVVVLSEVVLAPILIAAVISVLYARRLARRDRTDRGGI